MDTMTRNVEGSVGKQLLQAIWTELRLQSPRFEAMNEEAQGEVLDRLRLQVDTAVHDAIAGIAAGLPNRSGARPMTFNAGDTCGDKLGTLGTIAVPELGTLGTTPLEGVSRPRAGICPGSSIASVASLMHRPSVDIRPERCASDASTVHRVWKPRDTEGYETEGSRRECGASRRLGRGSCRSPWLYANGRCRLHGGPSTGPAKIVLKSLASEAAQRVAGEVGTTALLVLCDPDQFVGDLGSVQPRPDQGDMVGDEP